MPDPNRPPGPKTSTGPSPPDRPGARPTSSSGPDPVSSGRPTLREWPARDRPRERLRSAGARALSARELLAILVGSGTAGASAVAVAERILAEKGGSLRALATVPVQALEKVRGVGPATAARIAAALELGRRTASEAGVDDGDRIRGPRDVFRRMGPLLRDLRQEEFHSLLLNAQNRVLRDVLITRGVLDSSLIHAREVFRPAILESAAAVLLVHNHPSGDPDPSPEDRAVTRQLVEAGRAVGIHVLDHVVVGDGRFVSLSERGLLG